MNGAGWCRVVSSRLSEYRRRMRYQRGGATMSSSVRSVIVVFVLWAGLAAVAATLEAAVVKLAE